MSPDDYIVEPEHFLRYLRDVLKVKPSAARLPPRLILVFGSQDLDAFRRLLHARPVRWYGRLFVGQAGGHRVSVLRCAIGAPATVIALEEMRACGVCEVITFGACGSLVPDLPIGAPVVPTRAYSDEGTSRDYGTARWIRPDARMVARLRKACRRRGVEFREGGAWTTDAPYREGRRKARSLARRGVVAVDMEASAVYTVARVRKMRAASLFVVSDELGGDEWNAGFRHAAFLAGKRRAYPAVMDAITRDWR